MAIWQCEFIVLPKMLFNNNFDLKCYIDEDGFLDDESCWLIEPINVDFFNDIEQILPKNKSWSDKIILFGTQDSNCMEIYKNRDDNVIAASFRIDYTSYYEGILRLIINFIEMNSLVILDENLEVLENNFITIQLHIKNSNQRVIYDKLSK